THSRRLDTRIPTGRPRRRCPRGWPRHPVAARRSTSATCRHRHTSQGCRQPTNTIVPQSGGLLTSSWSAPATLKRRWAWTKITSFGPWKANDVHAPETPRLFTKAQFEWLPELETYRCPAGHLLKRVGRETCGRSGGREEVVVRYGVKAVTCQACPLRPQCTTSHKVGRSLRRSEHEELILAHQAWMETASAKAAYRLRKQTIELVFATLKEHRGLRRCSGHGLVRVRTELALEGLVHNLLV